MIPDRLCILLVGGYPPPVGGNSIHIKRLNELINRYEEFSSSVIDPFNDAVDPHELENAPENVYRGGPPSLFSLLKIAFRLRKSDADVIHFHISAMARFIFAGPLMMLFKLRKVRTVLTIHSGSFVNAFENYTTINKILGKCLLKSFDQIITVNNGQKIFLEKIGCDSEAIKTIPAYLPPESVETPELVSIVDRLKNADKKIIISSGYGIPLYGLDIIADLFSQNKKIRNNFSLVFCIYNTYDEEYLKSLENKLSQKSDYMILRDLNSEEFSYILKNSSIYVRATDRDGDAVAIREANYYGLPVVASDLPTVSRPEYCHLFDRNDLESLQEVIWLANSSDNSIPNGLDNNIDGILDVYKNLIA